MKITHYLNGGTAFILLSVAIIVAMNWTASGRVEEQYAVGRNNQFELQQIDKLRTAVHRIVSSTNELALIAMTGEDADAPDERSEAIAAEQDLIRSGVGEFRTSFDQIAAQLPQAKGWLGKVNADFQDLLDINTRLAAEISGPDASSQRVFALKEKQEEAELAVLAKLNDERSRLDTATAVEGAALAADMTGLRRYTVAAGILAALLLLASSLYINRRVGGMFNDIRSHQRAMEKANGDLSTALHSLKSLQDELVSKEKFAVLGRLTATVSHELRNPLSAIRNSAFILRDSAGSSREMGDFINRIDRSVTRCDHIIADLLEYTKTRALQLEVTDVGAWLASCIRDEINLPHIRIETETAGDRIQARIDRQRFVRAIINLLENAGQAIEGAKGRHGHDGLITVSCDRADGQACIRITDNGPGIPEGLRKKIFEPLFTTKTFGAGLGLSITANLVAEHGGTIAVDSTPGKGTTFTIRLPEARGESLEVAA